MGVNVGEGLDGGEVVGFGELLGNRQGFAGDEGGGAVGDGLREGVFGGGPLLDERTVCGVGHIRDVLRELVEA